MSRSALLATLRCERNAHGHRVAALAARRPHRRACLAGAESGACQTIETPFDEGRAEFDPFASEVRKLRDSWEQRREIDRYAHEPDFDAQFRILTVVHHWFQSAVDAVAAAYDGDGLAVEISDPPERTANAPGFRVTIAGSFFVDVELAAREVRGGQRWSVRAFLGTPDPRLGTLSAHALEIRQWTRARVHQVVLQLLAAFERSRTRDPAAFPGRDMGATGR